MGVTNQKGELGEAMVLADLQRKGYGVAIPFGHDLAFDLILIRKDSGRLERVQCKYTESDGRSLDVRCQSTSAWVRHTYGPGEVDWIAVFDVTTEGTRPAEAYLRPELDDGELPSNSAQALAMLSDPSPE